MKKHLIRRDFLKLKISNKSYKECQKELYIRYQKFYNIRTLKRWWKKFNESDWDLTDKSQRPKTIYYKVEDKTIKLIIKWRKNYGYSANQLRIKLIDNQIFLSNSYIKKLIRDKGLSRGNKMEGKRLKWVRFERPDPNYMWQLDGTETERGWILPIEDDCSRYCIVIAETKTMTTKDVIELLKRAIAMHGKPLQLLTDNGPEFGGTSRDSEFDKWCNKMEIVHIRSGVHKPTTVGKISAIQQTIQRELKYCNNDIELWRYRYNHERPHQSLRGLTPAKVYFQFRRHKKHYDL